MVRMWVANTDHDWFDFLSSLPGVDEINFWQPSGAANFAAVQPGELFLFRLKSPRNAIGGYGVFSHASNIPISLAWEAFEQKMALAIFSKCETVWVNIVISPIQQMRTIQLAVELSFSLFFSPD